MLFDCCSEKDFQKILLEAHPNGHIRHITKWLSYNGIHNVHELLNFGTEKLTELASCNAWIFLGALRVLDKYGYRMTDCPKDIYPDINEYFKKNFRCILCGSSLHSVEVDMDRFICKDCCEREHRLLSDKKIVINLSGFDEDDSETLTVCANIKNNTTSPLKIEIKDFYLLCSDIEVPPLDNSEYNTISEGFILPNTTRIFKKTWSKDDIKTNSDCFIIDICDKTHKKEYIYKITIWDKLLDYYEFDL